jgi:flagellar biosynthesis/type III secretory pathway M-ring protein FliF/YscJ
MTKALDTIATAMERDPESLARVLRRWIREG